MTLVEVTFRWDDKHGSCYDCGRPAAFYAATTFDRSPVLAQQYPDTKVCALCAANRAADGDSIKWIEEDI